MISVTSAPPDLSAWGIESTSTVRRADHGTNNLVWIIDETYVIRVYQNAGPTRVTAELRLLAELSRSDVMPFAITVPIATIGGELFVQTPSGPAVLFQYFAGRPARRSDLADLHRVGEALASLDLALAGLPNELAPVDGWVTLDKLHPAVPDVADLCAELSQYLPDDPGVRALREQVSGSDDVYQRLVQELPTQIVHDDMALSNVVMGADGDVVAVLDFEVAALDARVADLVAGLAMAVDWRTPQQEAQVAAYRRGYSTLITLEPREEAAIPHLLQRRRLGSVIWRAGRWRQGLATLDEVRLRLAELDTGG